MVQIRKNKDKYAARNLAGSQLLGLDDEEEKLRESEHAKNTYHGARDEEGGLPGQVRNPGDEDAVVDIQKEFREKSKAKLDIGMVAAGVQEMQKHKIFMEPSPWVISPRSKYMRRWDMVTLVLLLYTAVVTPVEVSFMDTKIDTLFWINRAVDGLFVKDIVLNFFVAIYDPEDGQLVFHHPTVVRSYLKGWFPIDVVSVFPFDLIALLMNTSSVGRMKVLRILRLLRLVKLLRILRAARIFARLETQYNIDYSMLELVRFAVLALVTSHWMACAWGLVADLEDSEYNWMKYTAFNTFHETGKLEVGQDPRGVVSTTDIYIAAFYWSSMTMTTIGFGDILPSTLIERIFVSFAMLVGAFVYGYIIGAVSNVISTKNAKKNDFYKLMGELNAFLKEGRWDHDLCMRLREYFKYRLASSHVDAHTALLQQMSPALRAEITLGMNTWITKVDFFRKCPEALVIQLTMNMKQSTYPPQEKILVPGDWCDKMFMVRKGVAICRQKIVTTGQVFCVECLYKEGKVSYSAHAVTFVDLFSFDRNMLVGALQYFPDVQKHFQRLSIKIVFREEVIAYSKAFRALETDGVNANVWDKMDERPDFYLKKLRMIYGDDGFGMRYDGASEQEMKERAAIKVQKVYRGYRGRVLSKVKSTEHGTSGVMPNSVRSMDPTMYTARALDVFHHRAGQSLHALHLKLDALLNGTEPRKDLERDVHDRSRSELFSTPLDGSGKKAAGMSSLASLAGNPAGSSSLPPVTVSKGIGGSAAVDAVKSEVDKLRRDLFDKLDRIKVTGGGGEQVMMGGAEDTQQLAVLVQSLAEQVGSITRTLSQMSDAQRTFQERSQRTILGHLEQAQTRMAEQVAKTMGGVSRPTAAPSRVSPGGVADMTESDLPPSRGYGGQYGGTSGGVAGVGTRALQRRPLGGSTPPARPTQGW